MSRSLLVEMPQGVLRNSLLPCLTLEHICALRLVCRSLQALIDEHCSIRHAWSEFWGLTDEGMVRRLLSLARESDWQPSTRYRAHTWSGMRSTVGCFLASCYFHDVWLLDQLHHSFPSCRPMAHALKLVNDQNVMEWLHRKLGLTLEDVRDDNCWPLRWSSSNGHLEVIKYLHESFIVVSLFSAIIKSQVFARTSVTGRMGRQICHIDLPMGRPPLGRLICKD